MRRRWRGNKGLMSLAEGGWRLRQMAWSLRHSGVVRLVLKSSSLTFQQILPGGWGVCHTTPRIHTAAHPLHPTAITTPSWSKFLLCRSGRASPWPPRIVFLRTYVYVRTLARMEVDNLGFRRAAKTRNTRGRGYEETLLDCSYGGGGIIERCGLGCVLTVQNLIQ